MKLSLLWKPKDSIFSWSVCSSTVICKLSYHGHSWVRALGGVAGIAAPLQQLFPGSSLQTKPNKFIFNSSSEPTSVKTMGPGTEYCSQILILLGDIVDSGIGCRPGPPMQLGGPVRQPYPRVNYTSQSRTNNLASGGHLSAGMSLTILSLAWNNLSITGQGEFC